MPKRLTFTPRKTPAKRSRRATVRTTGIVTRSRISLPTQFDNAYYQTKPFTISNTGAVSFDITETPTWISLFPTQGDTSLITFKSILRDDNDNSLAEFQWDSDGFDKEGILMKIPLAATRVDKLNVFRSGTGADAQLYLRCIARVRICPN